MLGKKMVLDNNKITIKATRIKFLFISFFVLFWGVQSNAQRVEWTDVIKTRSFPLTHYLGEIDSIYYIISAGEKIKHYYLLSYNKDGDFLNKVALKDCDYKFILPIIHGNEIYIAKDSPTKLYRKFRKINKNTGKFTEEELNTKKMIPKGHLQLCVNTNLENGSSILLTSKMRFGVNAALPGFNTDFVKKGQLKKTKYLITQIGSGNEVTEQVEFKIPRMKKNQFLLDGFFEKNGDLYLAILESNGKSDGDLLIYYYDLLLDKFSVIDHQTGVGKITKVDFNIDDGKLVCGALSKTKRKVDGYYYLSYNLDRKIIECSNHYKFTPKDFSIISGKAMGKSKELDSQFKALDVFFMNDGGIVLIAEYFKKIRSVGGSLNVKAVEYGDFLAIRLSKANEMQWIKRIEKSQKTTPTHSFASGSFCFKIDDEIHVLYNESTVKGNLISKIINSDGLIESTILGDSNKAVIPVFCRRLSDESIFLLSLEKRSIYGGITSFGKYYSE